MLTQCVYTHLSICSCIRLPYNVKEKELGASCATPTKGYIHDGLLELVRLLTELNRTLLKHISDASG
jgi:hypothetical protein